MRRYKDTSVAGALKPIYRAVNAADARKELDAFAQSEWAQIPYIAKQWIDSWIR
ncbi:transposase [Mesosutterella multiformis]|uniref:transposase n=1 Tax=Mesosutterella multiformis TaxID=2259133 RepID=UPI00351E421E